MVWFVQGGGGASVVNTIVVVVLEHIVRVPRAARVEHHEKKRFFFGRGEKTENYINCLLDSLIRYFFVLFHNTIYQKKNLRRSLLFFRSRVLFVWGAKVVFPNTLTKNDDKKMMCNPRRHTHWAWTERLAPRLYFFCSLVEMGGGG